VIGAQKSGTRWLRSNLGLHPDVYAATEELWYFNDARHRFKKHSPDWYREQFTGWRGEGFLGEASPGYLMLRHDPKVVAGRIHDVVPDVRLFAVLRNPIDRAYSAMVHHIAHHRIPPGADLVQLVRAASPDQEPRSLVEGGLYAQSLRPFLDRFGGQLLVLVHDDISRDPEHVYARALHHLGAEPFQPKGLREVRYSNQQKKLSSPLTWSRARFWPTSTPPARLTDEGRRELWTYFSDDVADLEELLGLDLSAWDPT
jgi:hypothetical protein